MAADNTLQLVIQVDADKANASPSLSSIETTAVSAAKGASRGIDGMTASMAKGLLPAKVQIFFEPVPERFRDHGLAVWGWSRHGIQKVPVPGAAIGQLAVQFQRRLKIFSTPL